MSDERVTHFSILVRGRATTVSPVRSKALSGLPQDRHSLNESLELVTKLYQPEEKLQSKPDMLKEVYKIAETNLYVQGHVPELVWFHKFEGTSTSKIRIALGLKDAKQAEQGSRVLCISVFRKLIPITTLSGKEFLAAWWQIVKCRFFPLLLLIIVHPLLQQVIAPSGREVCCTGMSVLAISWGTAYAVNL
jgi:hypothetical protein